MADQQVEKFKVIIHEVEEIQTRLDRLLAHLTDLREELEKEPEPLSEFSGPPHLADEIPHFGTIV